MDKKVVFGIMSTVLLLSVLGLTFNIQQVRAEPSTIIVPDDYPTIQKAINAANEGDTIFVRNGTYYENVVVNETVSLVGENRDTTIIDGGGGWVIVVDIAANNVVIREFTIKETNVVGINLSNSTDSKILANKIINCKYGIWLEDCSDDNNITNNTITSTQTPDPNNPPHLDGVVIKSNNNIIQGNIISNLADLGITCPYASNNTMQSNVITEIFGRFYDGGTLMAGWGIELYNSDYNRVIGNNITDFRYGIYASEYCDHNTIRDNNIMYATNSTGIQLKNHCDYNKIYHNNFDAPYQARVIESYNNTWDNGYPSGGNYWSDYDGNDTKHGVGQNINGSDGIGDTPYAIDQNNTDNYPPMVPWGLVNLTVKTYAIGRSELTDVKVWIDGESPFYSRVEVETGTGCHIIEIEYGFLRPGPWPGSFYKYTFDHWEDWSTDNPRYLNLDQMKTIIAYYKWKIIMWK